MAFLGSQQISMQRSNFFGSNKLLTQSRVQQASTPSGGLTVYAGRIGPGKLWEHTPLTPNGKPVRVKMHIKSGDLVQVIAGGDKGKVGKVSKVNTKTGEVLIEGVNIKTKHVKPTGEEEGGQIVKSEFPVHHSNVQHYSESASTISRVGFKVEDGRKVRYLKKTGEVLAEAK